MFGSAVESLQQAWVGEMGWRLRNSRSRTCRRPGPSHLLLENSGSVSDSVSDSVSVRASVRASASASASASDSASVRASASESVSVRASALDFGFRKLLKRSQCPIQS